MGSRAKRERVGKKIKHLMEEDMDAYEKEDNNGYTANHHP